MLTCIAMVFLNISGEPLNAQDFRVITRAQEVCAGEKYTGCIKSVQKRGNGAYRVMCQDKQFFDKKVFDIQEKYAIIEEQKALGLSEEEIKNKLRRLYETREIK